MLQVWSGGLGIWGAIGGGILGLMVATQIWKGRADFLRIGDAAALMLPFSQAIGRVGNFLNQELYGKPTEWPIGIYIQPERRMPGYETATHFQPLFAYEAGLLLLWGGWLWWLYRSKRLRFGQGGMLAFYFLGYGAIRLALEPLRIQPWEIGGLPTAMWFSVVVIAGAFWYLIKQRRKIWIKRKF
jgi:phosphatidylglycerol---prolipoprotein diacylglyceryl transferase